MKRVISLARRAKLMATSPVSARPAGAIHFYASVYKHLSRPPNILARHPSSFEEGSLFIIRRAETARASTPFGCHALNLATRSTRGRQKARLVGQSKPRRRGEARNARTMGFFCAQLRAHLSVIHRVRRTSRAGSWVRTFLASAFIALCRLVIVGLLEPRSLVRVAFFVPR